MKNILTGLLNILKFIIVCCVIGLFIYGWFNIFKSCKTDIDNDAVEHEHVINDAQYFYDHYLTHSVVKDSAGHTLILHEYGTRGTIHYSFSIEHSSECEMCTNVFD